MLGLASLAPVRRVVARPGVRLVAPVLRWALVNGASRRARRRVAAGAAPAAAGGEPPGQAADPRTETGPSSR